MTQRKKFLAVTLVLVGSLTTTGASVYASHVRIEGPSAPTVVIPAPTNAPLPTLQADEVKADLVRAHVIYANKIKADEVRGAVVQSRGIKVSDSQGEIKAPEVAASVIYADTINANTVVADTVYVHELERR